MNIYNLNGNLEYAAVSYRDAADFIGRSGALRGAGLAFYVNNTRSLYSSKLNKEVLLRTPPASGGEDSIITSRSVFQDSFLNAAPLKLVEKELEDLSLNFIYCFNENKIDFITGFTYADIYRALFPNQSTEQEQRGIHNKHLTPKKIRDRVNLDIPIIDELGNKHFIAKNPLRVDSATYRNTRVTWLVNVYTLYAELFLTKEKLSLYAKSHLDLGIGQEPVAAVEPLSPNPGSECLCEASITLPPLPTTAKGSEGLIISIKQIQTRLNKSVP